MDRGREASRTVLNLPNCLETLTSFRTCGPGRTCCRMQRAGVVFGRTLYWAIQVPVLFSNDTPWNLLLPCRSSSGQNSRPGLENLRNLFVGGSLIWCQLPTRARAHETWRRCDGRTTGSHSSPSCIAASDAAGTCTKLVTYCSRIQQCPYEAS